jgi:tripartite-type tricarboxylate transporter receptor subunit TctC
MQPAGRLVPQNDLWEGTMKLPRRSFLHLTAGAAALPAASRLAWAQTYPSRPITIVVGLAVGGSTDAIARLLAARMRQSLGQRVIVENVTGAGGTIAIGRVARAAPDGYTLSLGNLGSHVVAGATYAVHYDLLNDFEPIALLSTGPSVLVARKKVVRYLVYFINKYLDLIKLCNRLDSFRGGID